MWKHRASRGFTVVELLVGMGIAVVTAAVIFPAVQKGRVEARRVGCRNNMKQLGLALHNYNSAFRMFPPGWISSNHCGWQVMILPYVEEQNLYSTFDFNKEFDPKSKSVQRNLTVYRCPIDLGTGLANGLGRSNYAGVMVGKPSNTTGTSTHGGGSFGVNKCLGYRDYTDGTSNSLMVGERMSTARLAADEGTKGERKRTKGTEGTWVGLNPGELSIVSSAEMGLPNDPTYGAFSSWHPGGAHFLMADGSVHFVKDNINPRNFAALCTIGGGEQTEDF